MQRYQYLEFSFFCKQTINADEYECMYVCIFEIETVLSVSKISAALKYSYPAVHSPKPYRLPVKSRVTIFKTITTIIKKKLFLESYRIFLGNAFILKMPMQKRKKWKSTHWNHRFSYKGELQPFAALWAVICVAPFPTF